MMYYNDCVLMRATDVKNETNKDGSGKGQMAAWKVQLLVPLLRDDALSPLLPRRNLACR